MARSDVLLWTPAPILVAVVLPSFPIRELLTGQLAPLHLHLHLAGSCTLLLRLCLHLALSVASGGKGVVGDKKPRKWG